jgi:hypothetical protein
MGGLVYSILGPFLHLLVAKVVDDGQFIHILVFSNLLLDGLIDVGVDHSGVAAYIHLRLQLPVLRHQHIQVIGQLLQLRRQFALLTPQLEDVLVVPSPLACLVHLDLP